ncbi:MAG TPA: AAA family ATPase [Opitutaceae bacterium]|jgi:ATP-dependent Clp protease ATP-binding subunit ClpB
MGETAPGDTDGIFRGLLAHLVGSVVGQEDALRGLADALLAGEMGHARPGRPRSVVLLLGPTGTGKTESVLAASAHLFGAGMVARIDAAEFSSPERVPLLLGSQAGSPGILAGRISRMRETGGRILLLDEIEKAHPWVADYLLGIEAASLTLADGRALDLSDIHVIATSNVGSEGVVGLEAVSRASVRRFVEQEAAMKFRPEVLARFSAVLVFRHLSRDVQIEICRRMLGDELAHQGRVLSRVLGHPHRVLGGPEVCRRLVAEGWHRSLGARPMRNAVERRVRSALVAARLRGAIGPGLTSSVLVAAAGEGLRAAPSRVPVRL